MFIGDLLKSGYTPLQHYDTEFDVNYRLKRFACRVEERDERGRYVIEDDTAGDVVGAVLWRAEYKVGSVSTTPRNPGPKGTKQKNPSTKVRKDERPIPGWSWAWPSVVTTARKSKLDTVVRDPDASTLGPTAVRPIFTIEAQPDLRYKEKSPNQPNWASKLPKGWTGITTCASDDDRQTELLHPDFLGMVAVNNNGDAERSSKVFDLNADNSIDEDRNAHLHSMMRVVRPNNGVIPFNGNGLAWQLGTGGRDGLGGHGLVIDNVGPAGTPPAEPSDDSQGSGTTVNRSAGRGTGFSPGSIPRGGGGGPTGSGPPSMDGTVVACASVNASGPLDVGDLNDQHRIGITKDGQPINALHISTNALFKGSGGDCPIEFGGQYYPPGEGSRFKRAHLRHDPLAGHGWVGGAGNGLWRFLAESDTYVVDPTEPEGPGPTPTPPTGPRNPPGTPREPRTPPEPLGGPWIDPTTGKGGVVPGSPYNRVIKPDLITDSLKSVGPKWIFEDGELVEVPENDHSKKDLTLAEEYELEGGPPEPQTPDDEQSWTEDEWDDYFKRHKDWKEDFEEWYKKRMRPWEEWTDEEKEDWWRPWWENPRTERLRPKRTLPTPIKFRLKRDIADGHQMYCATTMDFAVPSLLIRPPLRETTKGEDLRKSTTANPFFQNEFDRLAPITMRMDSFAAQGSGGTTYTESPSKGRFRGGTSNGGIMYLPPEMDMEDLEEFDGDPPRVSLSTSYVVGKPQHIWFASALPDLPTGGIKSGHRWATDYDGDGSPVFKIDSVDASGSSTTRLTISAGGNTQVAANLEIAGALAHQGSTVGFYNASPASKSSGWTITNLTESKTLDCDSVTLAALADVVGSLIETLKNTGLIGG